MSSTRPEPAECPSVVSRITEFQRNAAFAAFIVVVVAHSAVSLITSFRSVLIPLIWASFFALPLERAVSCLEALVIRVISVLAHCRCRADEPRRVPFRHTPGLNLITIQRNHGHQALLSKVNNPCAGICGLRRLHVADDGSFDPSSSPRLLPSHISRQVRCCHRRSPVTCTVVFKCCKRRIRIKDIDYSGLDGDANSLENRLVSGYCYYIEEVLNDDSARGHAGEIQMQLFIDQGATRYPAVIENPTSSPSQQREVRGVFEVDKTSQLSWACALLLVLIFTFCGAALFVFLMMEGAQILEQNADDYKTGVSEVIDWVEDKTGKWIRPDVWQHISKEVTEALNSYVATMVESVAAGVGTFLFQVVMFVIYLFFWLSEPIAVSSSVVEVYKSYLFLTTCICLLFAAMMSALMASLGCKLWPLFFIITFFLGFIPEIGPIINFLLAIPAILFDGTITIDQRLWNTLILLGVGLMIKVLTANVIGVHMYATRGGEFMRMHPVVMMVTMMIFGALLGITGMFLAVPIIAAIKYYLMSSNIPAPIINPFLTFIEGDQMSPYRNMVDKLRASYDASNHSSTTDDRGGEAMATRLREQRRSPLLTTNGA